MDLPCRISGETDFPCIYGERVGLGRVYVKLDDDQPLSFDRWLAGVKDGRSYCCDGLSHLLDFSANGLGVGERQNGGEPSRLAVASGEKVTVKVRASALLAEEPREDIRRRSLNEQPYWHIERSRIGNTRKVPVELIVNGYPVEQREVEADGSIHDLQFTYTPARSSWIAVRILAGAHTNPIFVTVDGKPIRASKRSAQWCVDAVDVCWKSKEPQIRDSEKEQAKAAYDVAREAYKKILAGVVRRYSDRKTLETAIVVFWIAAARCSLGVSRFSFATGRDFTRREPRYCRGTALQRTGPTRNS